MNKPYGLILKGKNAPAKPAVIAAVFGDEDEEEKVDVSGTSRSAAALRTIRQAERQHDLARAEDPTIFDYDANYEQDERKKNEKVAENKKKDEVRASKYAEAILQSHQRRELERVSREERQQQKEREAENGEFADKEVFVTGAYRKQMEEVAKLREEEAYEARFNAMTAVEKQKVWQAGLSRTLLNDIARDGGEPVKKEDKGEKKERNTRKRLDSEEKEEEKKVETKEVKKKSIYDSDPEDEKDAPSHKNFSGELKAGLNTVNKKTKSQRVKERMFTPTPPSSDDEGTGKGRGRKSPSPSRDDRGRRRRDSSGDRRDDRERRKEKEKEGKRDRSPKEEKKEKKERVKDTAELKKERFEKLKEIVKKRNGPEQMEDLRVRYFERKASGFVTLPV